MVTLVDPTTAVTEKSGALVGGHSNTAWFHSAARAPGGCSTVCTYRLRFWSHHHQPAPFQTSVTPGFPASQKPVCRYTLRAGLQGTIPWSFQAFGSGKTQPTCLGKVWLLCLCTNRAGQGDWTSRLGEKSWSSPFCQGEWAAGEKLVGARSWAKSHKAPTCLLPLSSPRKSKALWRCS